MSDLPSRAARKRAGLSGYTFAVGLALRHMDGLLHHNVQPVIVQQLDEDDEDDQAETDDPQLLFHRQLKRIRRGQPVDRLVLRVG
jgi:hypothetical protein